MNMQSDIAFLKKSSFFSELNDEQLRLIAFGAERQVLSDGQMLYSENERARCAYVITTGLISLSSSDENREAGPGQFLTESALITETTRKQTAIAVGNATVLKISRDLFLRMLEEFPDVAQKVLIQTQEKLDQMMDGLAKVGKKLSL